MFNIDALSKLPREELIDIARKQGLNPHHATKDSTIVKMIVESIGNNNATVHNAAEYIDPRLQSKEAVYNTIDAVEGAIASIKVRSKDFIVVYDEEDKCVTFKCRGAEECHNMSVPLHWLSRRAALVARGRLALTSVNHLGFDNMPVGGNNAYTNTVLG